MESTSLASVSTRAVFVALSLSLFAGCAAATSSNPPPVRPQTWSITTGGSDQLEAIQALDYYPNSITIHAGDTVTWTNPTSIPHMIAIPQAGQSPPPGPPNSAPVGGNVFDNSAYISSGFLMHGKTYTVKFTAPGSYAYYCLVHPPEMTGLILVLPKTSPLPESASQYASQAMADLSADLQAGVAALQLFPYVPGGTHLAAGIAPGLPGGKPSQSTVVRFLDDTTTNGNMTIAVGTTLTWTNESNDVPHTVTFPIVGQPPPSGPPEKVPPSGGSTYDGTVLTNSGVMPPAANYSLTFTKAGTYNYYCLFHDGPTGMMGTVTVQ
jgi:plastocyanin